MRKLPELAVGSLGFCFYPLCSSAFWEFWYDLLEESRPVRGIAEFYRGTKKMTSSLEVGLGHKDETKRHLLLSVSRG